jgi:acyl-coenzyme A synthetase/AMP-(fatty) acid ligase
VDCSLVSIGNPFYPTPNVLLEMISHWNVTVFGCGAKYLTSLEKFGVLNYLKLIEDKTRNFSNQLVEGKLQRPT